jgi:eukaryotic-like serine/threonine-protein kinase
VNWLSDDAIARLRVAGAEPEFAGTRYRLIERIGSGGMGSVYLAEDATLGRRVAVKILDAPDSSGELAARLQREARILASLEHPGIVPVHDAGTLADGRVFYAMKFVEGESLDRFSEREGTLPGRLRIFQRICDTVAFAHTRGVLHRDLKPENIMTGPFGEVLVMDWGVAKILRANGISTAAEVAHDQPREAPAGSLAAVSSRPPPQTAHGAVLGTPGYMAPEQARGDVEDLDERADIYSLGAILQFLIEASAHGTQTAPRALTAIAGKAMDADPAARYASAAELGQDIARYLDGLPVLAYPENVLQKVARWAARYRLAIVLVLTYLVVRALLIFWFRR